MLCDNCGKNVATTHIKTVINGVVNEKNLCKECASNLEYESFAQSSLSQMLASVFGDAELLPHTASQKKCDCCGSTFADISRSGKAGCPDCYKTFYNELLPYIKRVHGNTVHIGKRPSNAENIIKQTNDTAADLKLELEKLIREEKYEEAAVIRDKIKALDEGDLQ